MNKTDIPIVEKLLARFEHPHPRPMGSLINPDGPEAAALLKQCVEALEEATAQLMLKPNSEASEARLLAVIDRGCALIAKVRAK